MSDTEHLPTDTEREQIEDDIERLKLALQEEEELIDSDDEDILQIDEGLFPGKKIKHIIIIAFVIIRIWKDCAYLIVVCSNFIWMFYTFNINGDIAKVASLLLQMAQIILFFNKKH